MGFGAVGGGITKLSELEIDADKEMVFKTLSLLGGLDKNSVRGDIYVFSFEDHAIPCVRKLIAKEAGKVLCSAGVGKEPFWAWVWEEPRALSSFDVYYACFIALTYDTWVGYHNKSIHEDPIPLSSEHEQAYGDAPADYIKRLTPALALGDSGTGGITPDKTHNENAAMTTDYDTNVV